MRWFWARFILLACGSAAFAEPPPLMLWAWEQAIDLRFLAGRSDVGVAYLAATAFVDKAGVRVQYRGVPMRAPEGMYRMPVLRIEGREGIGDKTPSVFRSAKIGGEGVCAEDVSGRKSVADIGDYGCR